jgi:hypothetical protein
MNNEHQYLEVGQEVVFIGPDKKPLKTKIAVVYGPDSARVEWENGSAIADYSSQKKEGTFHFAEASSKAETHK